MSDWQIGDLALCVRQDKDGDLVVGSVYTVTDLNESWLAIDGVGLFLAEIRSSGPDWDGYIASFFRKIHPLTDTEREEALRDLKAPVRETVQ